ncbi:HD-GYP domain-containing protein [Noviherbaspirillum sp. CPCC 100848]|uniref:HD-GYP domain-containing protein n=2 Tax=Noviherbaspirillum album TaxID=3080276 RepID=A0ABU6JFR3_9BURK|nr:HD-GYP domain-containing protein [Noviherbaspirillum sp. CPCC 100848]
MHISINISHNIFIRDVTFLARVCLALWIPLSLNGEANGTDMRIHKILKKALARVAPVSIFIILSAAALSYWQHQRIAEQGLARVLTAEALRGLHMGAIELPPEQRNEAIATEVQHMVGGLFAMISVYDEDGQRIASAVQPGYTDTAKAIAARAAVVSTGTDTYESLAVSGMRMLRVSVPLSTADGQVLGHLEAIREVHPVELETIHHSALLSGVVAAVAVLLATIVQFPLLTNLALANYRNAQLIMQGHMGVLEALGRAIAKRDSDTGIHNYRVTWIAARLGEAAQLSNEQMCNLIAGSFLHDVGKIGIPDAILLKPGKLDPRELEVMREHVAIGGQIAGDVGMLAYAREVIEGHHEKWDGSGYPKGLRGEAIPLAARIFCIADVFDALRTKRPYKEPFPFETAMQIMREGRSIHFDPELFDQFEAIAREIDELITRCSDRDVMHMTQQVVQKYFFFENIEA